MKTRSELQKYSDELRETELAIAQVEQTQRDLATERKQLLRKLEDNYGFIEATNEQSFELVQQANKLRQVIKAIVE